MRNAFVMNKYIHQYVRPNQEDSQMILVLDVFDMTLVDITGEPLEFLISYCKVLQDHYVDRVHQLYIINSSNMLKFI